MDKKVIIIGSGVAGMQTAITLHEMGIGSVIIEKDTVLGGKLNLWDRLFPTMTPVDEVLLPLVDAVRALEGAGVVELLLNTTVLGVDGDGCGVTVDGGGRIVGDAVVIASGFDLFDARIKEEYGYKIYDNVVTTVDLEQMFKQGRLLTADGRVPKTIAFLHCVGSRDEKVNQRHCSRVCCITGVKQAIEVKQAIPEAEIYSFYMDMRMFGPGYEELYRQAQQEYNIHFVRGRISEAAQTIDNRVQIKAEDTLIGRPIKMTVDLLVLVVGMKAGASNAVFAAAGGVGGVVELYPSGFVKPVNQFTQSVCSGSGNIFYAGTVTAPKNIGESINEGITAAYKISHYFNSQPNSPVAL